MIDGSHDLGSTVLLEGIKHKKRFTGTGEKRAHCMHFECATCFNLGLHALYPPPSHKKKKRGAPHERCFKQSDPSKSSPGPHARNATGPTPPPDPLLAQRLRSNTKQRTATQSVTNCRAYAHPIQSRTIPGPAGDTARALPTPAATF